MTGRKTLFAAALAAFVLMFVALGDQLASPVESASVSPSAEPTPPPPYDPTDPSQKVVPDSTPQLNVPPPVFPRRGGIGPQTLTVASERGFYIVDSPSVRDLEISHSASTTFQFPPSTGPSTDRTLYITAKATRWCLESLTAYWRYSGMSTTQRYWFTYDGCPGGMGWNAASKVINSTFVSKYVRTFGSTRRYYTNILTMVDGLVHVLLFNFNTGNWENQFAKAIPEVYGNGWTFFEYETGNAAGCPPIETQYARDALIFVDGVQELLTPEYSFNLASPGGCFVSGQYVFDVVNPNYAWNGRSAP